MRRLLFILLTLAPLQVNASAILGFGVGATTQYESEDELVEFEEGFNPALGLELVLIPRLTIDIQGSFRSDRAYTDYQNGADTVTDLKTKATTITGSIGPRFRFLSFPRLRFFAGGGYTAGKVELEYAKSDYFAQTLSDGSTFKQAEESALNGYYYEGGFEYILTNVSALRFLGRKTTYATEELQTLGNQKLQVDIFQVSVQFLHFFHF